MFRTGNRGPPPLAAGPRIDLAHRPPAAAGALVNTIERLSAPASNDVAGAYIAYQTRVDGKTPNNSGPGLYGWNAGQIAASATLRM
jgi:hypothetical protein